ncbi:MAG: hypothetical protein GWN84_16905 [Gammaproteobacteria bacterium]|nr:hypothetical protein [Gammaproteobacteria bacterium]NIR84517.1 hypothetical protein [Gammaproteobacteria bacterium]NIR90420.1 hypothetical protein [Gammaproteobacteria bacterium]NIU05568.1 hypothetical protein [Gammaproteobacteria bacterium]NIV52707.1 hypothetical protein [Gammaproteobacteria bacterium]
MSKQQPDPRLPERQRPPRSPLQRAVILIAGWMFLVLGVLGLFLPVLQGLLFLALGLYLLSLESRWAHRQLHRLRARYPRLSNTIDQAHLRYERITRRIRDIW